MSRPTMPQSNTFDSRYISNSGNRDRSRGRGGRGRGRGPWRPNRGHRPHSQRPAQQSPGAQQPGTSEVFDWFHQDFRPADSAENRSDSRSSSPFLPQYLNSYGLPSCESRGNHGRSRRNSSGSTQSNQEKKQIPRYLKFNQLLKLSQMNGNEIATEVSDNSDFKLLLNSEMNFTNNGPGPGKDFLVLTLRTLAKLERASFMRIVINILGDVCESRFLDNLERYLVALPAESATAATKHNKFYWEDINRFWNNLYAFFKTIIELVPVDAHDRLLPILEVTRKYVIESLRCKQDHNIDKDVQPRFRELHHCLKKKVQNEVHVPGNEMLQDFRNLSIIPTIEDLNDHHPYIRACKTSGAYDSVDHYLDVQFRLLREDFISPLRTGIQEYKRLAETNNQSTQTSDIRIFNKVKIKGPTVVKNKVGITIFFGIMRKVNWHRSKLFMYGSLLCLSKDNFESVLFATVVERDSQLLEKGELVIEPCEGTEITRDSYNSEYVMVESKVYFLPYYHTLNSMRYMSEKNFPMKRYVVDAHTTPSPPKYLDRTTVYVYKGFEIPVMDEKQWPRAKHLKLDDSQYEAFKCALLQELSVLHGPPGTGKTFMALQIASTLLTNSSSWYDTNDPTPMIVVCLTNHALDQFLEGILSYTDSLVRIGEQSKNPNLVKYKLKAVRDNYFKDDRKKSRAYQRMSYYRRQLKLVFDMLGTKYSALRALTSDTCIVSPRTLSQYCQDNGLEGLTSKDLLTKLFNANQAALALEISTVPIDSRQSAEDDDSGSEDQNIDADDDLEVASVMCTNDSDFTCLEISRLDTVIQKYETEFTISQFDADLGTKLRQLQFLRKEMLAKLNRHPLGANESGGSGSRPTRDWQIYYHWLTSSYEVLKQQIDKLETEYQEMSSQLNDFKQMTDLEVMRNSLVIGLTTTGAARLHECLRALRSPIVLVEEAAEILEAHVMCSLTEFCQQVILIGDHKQLRPKPATYELEKNYNMDISLFERIVKMRDKCTQLVIQHRMRPEIAELISPSIYERLVNHPSVITYPAVKGLEKNLFFLNHRNHEVGSSESESMSNPFEVKFLLAFAKYLIQQEYAPHEITILCTYNGQLFKFREAKKSMQKLRDVRITTVDNYQGEENRIILLSLVRNNASGNIGFLKTENRVCVALSRAREGLYIMGNMNNLVMRNEIWPKVKRSLEQNNAIGNFLVLQCQIHTDQLTKIKCAADFQNLPNGGCSRKCDAALACGHTCQKLCHIAGRDHKDHTCKQPCLKKCPNGHSCKLLCNTSCQPCREIVIVELKCGHTVSIPCDTNLAKYQCETTVAALLRCGHTVEKPCHRNTSTFPCSHNCERLLSCGHLCQNKCHINDDPHHLNYVCRQNCKNTALGCPHSHPCPKNCYEPCGACTTSILKDRSCGHRYNIQCSQDAEKIVCSRRCKRILPCGHKCNKNCNLPCGNCEEMVNKIVFECGHEVKIPCFKEPTVTDCKGQCEKILKCGHPCKAKCCEPCTKHCEYPRPLAQRALCQHFYPAPCYIIEVGLAEYADEFLRHCMTPCATLLPCGHTCSGTCGSCKQGRIHQPCREKCKRKLACGHKCKALCKDMCPPCQEICLLKCDHKECQKKCGAPCIPCQEPCARQCVHSKCTKKCSEICDRESCEERCPAYLICGHPCIGFCGEPCPPLCRICDKKDLPNFNTRKQEPGPRFVFLQKCGHSIERNYLDWTWKGSRKIGIPVCPICHTRITYCTRYSNLIKQQCKNMEIVEMEVSRRLKLLRADQQKIVNDINLIEQEHALHLPGVEVHKRLFQSLKTLANSRKTISIKLLKDISIKLTITGMILQKLQEIPAIDREIDDWPVVLNQMIMLTSSLPTHESISDQMINDIETELRRLHYMIQFCKLEKDIGFNKKENALQVEMIYLGLFNLKKFTSSRSEAIYKQLSQLKNSLKSCAVINEIIQMKVRIIGFNDSDWFRCPNGHIYSTKCEQCPEAPMEPEEVKNPGILDQKKE